MRIGDLLIAAGLVSREQVEAALERQKTTGGRLGMNLVAIGAIDQPSLDAFLAGIPAEPMSVAETGIPETELTNLMLKAMMVGALQTVSAISDWTKLTPKLVTNLVEDAVDGQLLTALGQGDGLMRGVRYALSERGRKRATEALAASSYAGPAPVTLANYVDRIARQKVSNENIDWEKIHACFADLEITDAFVEQIGPAVRSGRAILLYGPPGNGKTSIAQRLNKAFSDVIYIPHAVMIEGQIMTVFDPDVHVPAGSHGAHADSTSLHREGFDQRWVPCRRPFLITGGELTLEMLDLRYEPTANFYSAPLHVKAAGGCLLIDDFGRQLVSPTELLNRWIVPLESRMDYLKLHTGKSFALPFEAVVIFSTNLSPSDLMDGAFLRRIPYKLEIAAPSLAAFRVIFEKVARANSLQLTDEVFDYIVDQITQVSGVDLAAYQPGFLIEQVVAACGFRDIPPRFERKFVDFALSNLTVRESGTKAKTAARA